MAIVQARMGSSRLPGKSMLDLHGYPVIEWVFRRASKACLLDHLVFAIPKSKKDDPLYDYLSGLGANVFRGDEFDLIDRLYHAATEWKAGYIVRICADCPFVSGSEIDRLIDFFMGGDLDYAYNNFPDNNCYPDGIGAEIIPFDILAEIHKEAKGSGDREHITTYIRSCPEKYKMATFDPEDSRLHYPEIKIDLDTPQDYELLLRLKVDIEMEAHEIVSAARALL